MNLFLGKGRLTRDPEIRYTTGATPTAIAKFSLAVNRKYKKEGQPDADFFNMLAIGKLGEFVEKYLRKGQEIVVEATVQNRSWDGDNGQKHYITEMLCNSIEFCGSKADNNNTPRQQTHPQNKQPVMEEAIDTSDDLPF